MIYYHVYKNKDKWKVKRSDSKIAVKLFKNKNQAINFAIEISKNKYRVVVHEIDMKVSKII